MVGANFNKDLSMQPIAKILRALAGDYSCKICKQIEQWPNFASTLTGPIGTPTSLDV